MRSIIGIAAAEGWIVYQMDVFNVLIQGDLFEEVCMELPNGFISQGGHKVCKLIKTLYGLKQDCRKWNAKLIDALYLKDISKVN